MDDEILGWGGLILVILLIWPIWSSVHSPTNGEHTGYVTAVENSGYVFHTWTAYVKTNTQSSHEDKYCVTDSSVVQALQYAQENGAKITIEYGDNFFMPFWQCKGSDQSIINNIK